jgi:hypothetical protein
MIGNRQAEILSPRIRLLQQTPQQNWNAALSDFWSEIEKQGSPLVEPDSEEYS